MGFGQSKSRKNFDYRVSGLAIYFIMNRIHKNMHHQDEIIQNCEAFDINRLS